MRICLILEGCYPYIFGGVSTWMHQYINEMKEHEFVLWVIGANAKDKGKFVYELPKNVVEVHEVFLDDALRLKDSGKMLHAFTDHYPETVRTGDGRSGSRVQEKCFMPLQRKRRTA